VIDDGIKVVVGPIEIVAGLRQQGNNNITVLSVGWDSFDNLSRFEEVDYNQRKAETEDSAGMCTSRSKIWCCATSASTISHQKKDWHFPRAHAVPDILVERRAGKDRSYSFTTLYRFFYLILRSASTHKK
jgi:hypothetical protein